MIISDEYKFVFVHIPKCAGSSVKAANQNIDNRFAYPPIEDHETLGTLHTTHLPLWCLREYFPDAFKSLLEYRSFAVTRDPMERFGSAVMQRCREFLKFANADITPDVLVSTARDVIDHWTTNPKSVDHQFVHFTPQSQYIRLDGETIVDHVDLPGQFTRLNKFLAANGLNEISEASRKNASVEPRNSALRAILNPLRPIYRAILPADLKTKLWLKLIDKGVYGPIEDGYAPLRDDKFIFGFINDFYAEDFEIYQKALDNEPRTEGRTAA